MKYTGFLVENYKGIERLKIDLDFLPNPNIFTLVGLNESGKTTILEAIDFHQASGIDINSLVPKSKKDNFNGSISVTASVKLDEDDEQRVKEFAAKKWVELTKKIAKFDIQKKCAFVNSKHDPSKDKPYWTISIVGKTNATPPAVQTGETPPPPPQSQEIDDTDPVWQAIVKFIREELLPKIVYYPNFLFNFPKSVYLEEHPNEGDEQEFYRAVLQDVLDSLDSDLDLDTHLLARAKTNSDVDKENIEAVLNKMSAKITTSVFTKWGSISGTPVNNKEVSLGDSIKKDNEGHHYIDIKIKEGSHSYYVSERSLGFRWFFAFLLATQFRKYRRDEVSNTLFLLDEPASNLHQTGQQELLSSLELLTDGSMAMYSTHSHHLINPEWLSGAFIVKNRGIDLEKEPLEDNFVESKTDIIAERYHRYVANHPNEETYFQPILDSLHHRPGLLEKIPNIVILEGKFDFYAFKYFQDIIIKRPKYSLHLYPGAGASKHEDIIALYLAWGRKFIVLLDDDRGGKEAKKRYIELFGKLGENNVFTLADVSPDFNGLTTEDLFDSVEREKLMQEVFPAQPTYEKSKFNTALQEKYINGIEYKFENDTKKKFSAVLNFLQGKMDAYGRINILQKIPHKIAAMQLA